MRSRYAQQAHGYYREPYWLVDALLAKERPFERRVWDPFCGAGDVDVRRGRLSSGLCE